MRLREWSGKVANRALRSCRSVGASMRSRAAPLLGLPVGGPLVQLYRQDDEYETTLALVNFVSIFASGVAVEVHYRIVAHDAAGRIAGRVALTLGPGESRQIPFAELLPGVRGHGTFALSARLRPAYHPAMRFLGRPTPQFMTLLTPRDPRQPALVLHSHKLYERRVFFSPVRRASAAIERSHGLAAMEWFVMNSSASPSRGELRLLDAASGACWRSSSVTLAAHGVSRHRFALTDQSPPDLLQVELALDRRIDHLKPFVFKTTLDGLTTCSHA